MLLPNGRGPLSLTSASGEKQRPSIPGILPSQFPSRSFLAQAGACPPSKPRASAAIPRGGAEAGAEMGLEPCAKAWRGAEHSAPVPPARKSVPIGRGPMAGRKMAAWSSTDSHVSPRYSRTPPPPLSESRTPRDAQPQAASPPPEYRAGWPERGRPAAEGQFSPPLAPNAGAGIGLRERRKTILPATRTRVRAA